MPLPVAGGLFAWLVGLFGSAIGGFATWLMQRFVYEKAIHYALVTAFLVAAAGMFLAVTLSVKAAVIAVQVGMPNSLAIVTYFLPGNLGQIIALLVTARLALNIYTWTTRVMAAYLPGAPGYGSLVQRG